MYRSNEYLQSNADGTEDRTRDPRSGTQRLHPINQFRKQPEHPHAHGRSTIPALSSPYK